MTIKLSTTNSVKKTLQHKALWDLKTPYQDCLGEVEGERGEGGGETVEAAVTRASRGVFL